MAEECSADSVIAETSPTPVNWWDLHRSSLSSWNTTATNTWHQPNPNSSSSCDKNVSGSNPSFTNASNHSSLTVESSRRRFEPAVSSTEFVGEHASDDHIWNHVLFGTQNPKAKAKERLENSSSNGNLQSNQDNGQNFLDVFSSKSMSNGVFDPVCNYLKKLDNSWDYNHCSTSFNNFEKQPLGGCCETMEESERLRRLSDLVSNWSITPPYPKVKTHFELQSSSVNHGAHSDRQAAGIFPFYDHDVKEENDNHSGVHEASLGRSCNGSYGYLIGVNSPSPMIGENGKYYYYGASNFPTPCTSARNFPDMAINTQLSKQFVGSHVPKPSFKPLNLSECRKQDIQTSAISMKSSGGRRPQTTITEAKKKRSEDSTETALKKPKHESSASSSTQAPKVKLGDRITTLQQIVSPFGKTDTASVLYEAIGYIKFLQEQVQLLSDPYLKANSHKDTWGSFDRKNKVDVNHDLGSKGLCLIPISCTPQVYRENTGPDYWTPAYRGCLYR